MPQHRAGLLLVPVAARVDDHLAGDPGGHRRAVPDRDQVQRQVDAAGDPGRGRHPVVDDVEHVADDRRPRIAPGQLVLDVVVGGAAAPVEQAGPAEGVGARADAGDGAAVRVVAAQPREGGVRLSAPAPARAGDARQPGTMTQVSWPLATASWSSAWTVTPWAVGTSLPLADVVQPVAAAEIAGGAERLGRPGQVEQVQPGDEQEDDAGHDPVRLPGRCEHFRDRGDGREPPGQGVLGPLDDGAGGQRTRVGEQLLDALRPGAASRWAIGLVAVASVTNVTW